MTTPPSPTPPSVLKPGSRLGHYLIVHALDTPNKYPTYKAIDQISERTVLIEFLGSLADDQFKLALSISELKHPNIVPCYELAEERGEFYFALAFMAGSSMESSILSGQVLDAPRAARVLRQAISALDYAAKAGVYHLDLKPANLIVGPGDVLMLGYFSVYADGAYPGTPAYASPEHILQKKPDVRTDIYLLGACLFHLMTGAFPYPGSSVEEVCRKHVESPFPIEALRSFGVDAGWCELIRKMMEKDPAKRFQSYAELVTVLGEIQPETTEAKPAAPAARTEADQAVREELIQLYTKDLLPKLESEFSGVVNRSELSAKIESWIERWFTDQNLPVRPELKKKLSQKLCYELVGYGPLEQLLNDESVQEILVNGPGTIYVERNGRLSLSPIQFVDEKRCRLAIDRILASSGCVVSAAKPICKTNLPDGSQVQVVLPPVAINGPLITIRKHSNYRMTLEKLVQFKALSHEMALFLEASVRAMLNTLICGGMEAGRHTFLQALLQFTDPIERIVTIENGSRLNVPDRNFARMECHDSIKGVSAEDLLHAALSMAPTRIVLTECKGDEAYALVKAMNAMSGTLATIQANSPTDGLTELETLASVRAKPAEALRARIASGLSIVVQIHRLADGSRKVTSISEVEGIGERGIKLQTIFHYVQSGVTENGKMIGVSQGLGFIPRAHAAFHRNDISVSKWIYNSVLHHNNPEHP